MPPSVFLPCWHSFWHVSINSDVPSVFFCSCRKNQNSTAMLHVLPSLCWRASRRAKMVMQPWSPCHEHQHALQIILTYAIDNDCFVTVHCFFVDFNSRMRERRYYTSSIPLCYIGSILYNLLTVHCVLFGKPLWGWRLNVPRASSIRLISHACLSYFYEASVFALTHSRPDAALEWPELYQDRAWAKIQLSKTALRVRRAPSAISLPFSRVYYLCYTEPPPVFLKNSARLKYTVIFRSGFLLRKTSSIAQVIDGYKRYTYFPCCKVWFCFVFDWITRWF